MIDEFTRESLAIDVAGSIRSGRVIEVLSRLVSARAMTRRGGRRKGDPGRRNDGIFKRCRCGRKRWGECLHPWYFNLCLEHVSYRFNLTQRAGLPRRHSLSRTEAERWRDHFRNLARDGNISRRGKLLRPDQKEPGQADTLRTVADALIDHWKNDPNRRPHRLPALEKHLASICRTEVGGTPIGNRVFREIRSADIESFRDARRKILREREAERVERARRLAVDDADADELRVSPELPHARQGEVGINRALERLRALFNWAIERGYREDNPFLKNGRPAIRMAKEIHRTRRLVGDEETRLLAYAGSHLRALIVAAIDTGMRRRELLTLQWKHVVLDGEGQAKAFMIEAERSKTNRPRTIPILSQRLRDTLAERRLGPDERPLGREAFVFGNEVGEAVGEFKRAWNTACRRAGITGLHFHDLRRECGSRWLEGGVGLLTVSTLLGHSSVTTTNIYLASSPVLAEAELRAYEARRKAFPNLSQSGPNAPPHDEAVIEAVH